MRLLIAGGRVVDPSLGLDEYMDILIEDGCIRDISPRLRKPGVAVLDADGRVVCPGLIDIHVHFRDFGQAYKETIATGSRAAAMGGFTTVVCEPNSVPPVDNVTMLDRWIRRVRRHGCVNAYTLVCITRGSAGMHLTRLDSLSERGAVVGATDDGNPVVRDTVMQRAFAASRKYHVLLTPHCEESPASIALRRRISPQEPLTDDVLTYRREPAYIERDILFAEQMGCPVHISHVSMAASVMLIRAARARGAAVSGEATPHHLTLTADAVREHGTNAKVNPPLRTEHDVAALRGALQDGTVEIIASDHAPHAPEEKAREWNEAPFGVIGLETTLGVILTSLVHPGIMTLSQAVACMSTNPARILKLPGGTLDIGVPADVTIVDPDLRWTVDASSFLSKGRNTPFNGWMLRGKAVTTMVRGQVMMKDGTCMA
jgi:dihydroorotase